ncbi:MAG TPA: hypothetical protein VMD09_05675 [Solirubrobacteraceae bacterium]|nr:hypothetical protein [Solirubrobacteraceae bacterium]
MASSEATDQVEEFTIGILRAGSMLFGVASDLIEDLPEDAFPGEDTAAVVIEMLVGTIRTAVESADPQDLERATELLAMACDRVLEHLRLAVALRQRMDAGDGDGQARIFG